MEVHNDKDEAALLTLKTVFADQPDLLEIVTARDLESQQVLGELRERENLLASPVRQYVVGQTRAGKTSIGNRLYGADAMKSTGHQDCTDFIGLLRLRSNLHFIDTPGAGSKERYENWARLALGLPQLDDAPADRLGVHDYTDARFAADGVLHGVTKSEFTAAQWETELAGRFSPDVIVYVVSPHMMFIRADRVFLTAVLRRHGAKVVIALNDWAGITTDVHREDAVSEIRAIYAALYPDGSLQPAFVRVNALTGSGMSELTSEICRVIAPEKLGSMRQVLNEDLKESAQRVRRERWRAVLNRIAARMAFYLSDQKLGNQHLISAVAAGVGRQGVLTFEADDLAATLSADLGDLLESRAQDIQRDRQKDITVQDPQYGWRDITVPVPIIETEEVTTSKSVSVPVDKVERIDVGLLDMLGAYWDAGVAHVDALLSGADDSVHKDITEKRKNVTAPVRVTTGTQNVDIPVTEVRQKVSGYTTQVVDRVQEVTGTVERVLERRPLSGGAPVIELLTAVGRGIEAYCTAGSGQPVMMFIDAEQAKVRLALERVAPEIEALLEGGATAEQELIELLGRVL